MKFTRIIDDLGRVVIPAEIRKNLGVSTGDKLNVELEGHKVIITTNAENRCTFCGKPATIEVANGHLICKSCAKIIQKGQKEND